MDWDRLRKEAFMSRKKQLITLFIGLIFFSTILFLTLDQSNSKEASHSNSQTKVAATEVQKQTAADQSSTSQVKPEDTTKAQDQASTTANKQTPAVKSSPVSQPAKTTSQPANREENVSRGGGRTLYMVATGYTDAPEENWPYAGMPSYIGMPLQRGVVAVDPNVIPMGTKLYVEGYGDAIAADQGGAIKGNRIDLFFDSKSEAYNWGMRTVKVTIIE